jgi:hypothetical protein
VDVGVTVGVGVAVWAPLYVIVYWVQVAPAFGVSTI